MRMAREFSRRLIAAGKPGSIVNITSITGQQTKAYLSIYGTAKAALIQLTRQLAIDLLPHNIRVNAIAPGYFRTAMVDWYFDSDAGKTEAIWPAKRWIAGRAGWAPAVAGERCGVLHEWCDSACRLRSRRAHIQHMKAQHRAIRSFGKR
jgi:NAD(P)-dependent dehydrogenase (short-subunit alcohol dehydrogenase family)